MNRVPAIVRALNSQSRSMALAASARKIVPLLDRVLIEKIEAQKKSKGGLLLPDSAVTQMNEGKVIAVGPGNRTNEGTIIPLSVKEGDEVLLPEYGGSKVTIDGKDLFLYRDDDLLGVIQK